MKSRLLNELAAQGCGIEESLKETFMGNEGFYEKILRRLPESDCLPRIAEAVRNNDAKAAFAASHELKGIYGNLGLTPLYKSCCEIVEITRAGSLEGVAEKVPELEALHVNVVGIIASY